MKNPQNFVDCETVVFFANARDAGSNSNEWSRASIETRKDYAYGASRLPNREEKTTFMQCTKFTKIRSHENFMPHGYYIISRVITQQAGRKGSVHTTPEKVLITQLYFYG